MSGKNVKAGGAYVELGLQDKLAAGLKKVEAKLRAFGAGAAQIGASVAGVGAAIVGPLVGAAKVFGSVGANLDDISKRVGVSGSALSELSFAADQSGTSIDSVAKGLGKMAKVLYSADEESKNAVDSLADLGLSVEDLRRLSPVEQFAAIGEAIKKIEDPSKRSALAMQIFGGAGAELIPLFEDGAAGLDAMARRARELGLVLDEKAISSAADLDDAFSMMGASIQGLIMKFGEAVAGPLTAFLESASGILGVVSQWVAANSYLVTAVAGLGVILSGAGLAIAAIGGLSTVFAMGLSAIGSALAIVGPLLAALTSPLALVLAGIGAVTAALFYWTDIFDPVVEYVGEALAWLSEITGETVAGISASLTAGDIEGAAIIAFTGLRLVVSQVMDSVLGLFGSSIQKMSDLLAWLYKQIGTVLSRLNEARAQSSQWLAQGMGWLAGVEVLDGDNAALMAARQWSNSWDNLDVTSLAQTIETALDPEVLRASLDGLVQEAQTKAATAIDLTRKRAQFETPAAEAVAMAAGSMPKAMGGFSVADLERSISGPRDFAKKTERNTAKTVEKLEEVIAILPSILPTYG